MKGREIENEYLKTYDEIADAVFRRCYFKTSNREVAEDLTQEAFVRTWNYLQESDREIDNLKAFIFATANNLIKDYYKKAKSHPFSALGEFDSSLIQDSNTDPSRSAAASQAIKLLGELSDEDRDLLTLRYVEEWEVKEIAEVYGERANTIAVRVHRAKEKFDTLLRERYGLEAEKDEE